MDSLDGQRRDSLAIDVALLAVVLMWASTFTLFKIAWHDIDPVAFTGIRFAAMFLFALALLATSRGRTKLRRQDIPLVIAAGLTGYFLYQMGFVLGLDRTTALASAILIATHPIFAVVFSWLLRRERPNRMEVAGVAVGFLGVAVFLRAWDAVAAARPGDLLSLGAAAAFGAYSVINQPLSKRYPSREMMAYGLAVGGVLIALVGLPAMVHQDWGAVRWPAWLILVYAVVGPYTWPMPCGTGPYGIGGSPGPWCTGFWCRSWEGRSPWSHWESTSIRKKRWAPSWWWRGSSSPASARRPAPAGGPNGPSAPRAARPWKK